MSSRFDYFRRMADASETRLFEGKPKESSRNVDGVPIVSDVYEYDVYARRNVLCEEVLTTLTEALTKSEWDKYTDLMGWWNEIRRELPTGMVYKVERDLAIAGAMRTAKAIKGDDDASTDEMIKEIIRRLQRARTELEIRLAVVAQGTPSDRRHRTLLRNFQKRAKSEAHRNYSLPQLEVMYQEAIEAKLGGVSGWHEGAPLPKDGKFWAGVTNYFKKTIGLKESVVETSRGSL